MDESLRLPPRLAAILEAPPPEDLAFVPVPVKPRRDGWTPDPVRTLNRLLEEIDPGGAGRPQKSNDFSPRFA